MIVVDTSVWIDVIRRPTSARADAFRSLLDAGAVLPNHRVTEPQRGVPLAVTPWFVISAHPTNQFEFVDQCPPSRR